MKWVIDLNMKPKQENITESLCNLGLSSDFLARIKNTNHKKIDKFGLHQN